MIGLELYPDLLANVRHDGLYHSIKVLFQPHDPDVQVIAALLKQAPDFVTACHQFVDNFTTYRREIGDYWEIPAEVIAEEAADCDGKAIFLLSLLRTKIAPEDVFAAFGIWQNGRSEGHMWVLMNGSKFDKILESTTGPRSPLHGQYHLMAMFNDIYTFATPQAIREFDLKVPELVIP